MVADNTKVIKELLEIVKNKVDKIELRQSTQSSQINMIGEQQSVMNEKLDEHGERLWKELKTKKMLFQET